MSSADVIDGPFEKRVTLCKACDRCIQAKKRCSRNLPKCLRCSKMKTPCRYKNTPLNGQLPAPSDVSMLVARQYGPRQSDEAPTNSPFFRGVAEAIKNSYSLQPVAPGLAKMQMPEPEIILAMDKSSVIYLLDHLKSFPSVLIQTGQAPFIHPQLYENGLPPSLQGILTLCNQCIHANTSNHHTLSIDISNAARVLLSSRPALHTFKSKLAFVQSLILLQIITLFSPSPPITQLLRQQAENRVLLLNDSVEDLYRSTPATLPSSMHPYQAWVLAESCRRTMHIAHLLHGVYLMLTRGNINVTMFVKALPLCRDVELWDLRSSTNGNLSDWAGDRSERASVLDAELISYRELTDMWDNDEIKKLHLFEEMLIVACQGIDKVRARFSKVHLPQASIEGFSADQVIYSTS